MKFSKQVIESLYLGDISDLKIKIDNLKQQLINEKKARSEVEIYYKQRLVDQQTHFEAFRASKVLYEMFLLIDSVWNCFAMFKYQCLIFRYHSVSILLLSTENFLKYAILETTKKMKHQWHTVRSPKREIHATE